MLVNSSRRGVRFGGFAGVGLRLADAGISICPNMMRNLYLRESRVKHPYVWKNDIREAAYDKIGEKLVVMRPCE